MAQLIDIAIDVIGEISIGVNGDIEIARDEEVMEDTIIWRTKTYKGDWVLEPQDGASLEDLIGEPNIPKTAGDMEEKIVEALTNDGLLSAELKEVQVVPISRQELLGLITVEFGNQLFSITVSLDLKEGIL